MILAIWGNTALCQSGEIVAHTRIVESVWNSSVHITTTSVVVVRSILDATVRQEWGRSWPGDKLVLEPPNYAAACQLRGGGAAFLV